MTHLIKFIVGRDTGFRDQPQNPAAVNSRRGIVELSVAGDRKPRKNQRVRPRGLRGNGEKPLLRPGQQLLLPEKVPAAVPRNTQLRQHNDFCPRIRRFPDTGYNFCIIARVRHPDFRRDRRSFHKSLSHLSLISVKRQAVLPA